MSFNSSPFVGLHAKPPSCKLISIGLDPRSGPSPPPLTTYLPPCWPLLSDMWTADGRPVQHRQGHLFPVPNSHHHSP